jgi:hypothetical protein
MNETVEEFLARGGKIQKSPEEYTQTVRPTLEYSDKEKEDRLHNFYQSKAWRDLRDSIKRNLTKMCPVCGSEENLVVDHIKPLRFFWEERLNPDNLQILCGDCNKEKGSTVNWTLEWHLANKKQLSDDREAIDYTKKKEEHRKSVIKENATAFIGMVEYEKRELNSCFSSYIERCRIAKITPVSKTRFRHFIESRMPNIISETWRHPNAIKQFIKKNYDKIE